MISPENALVALGLGLALLVLSAVAVGLARRFLGWERFGSFFDDDQWDDWMQEHHGPT